MSDARNTVDDEDVDLDAETRKRVLELHAGLDQRDHYQLLGVMRDADRKAVKRAYYDLAATFHPDRYFRKKLGSYKTRMEVIFSRATLAHDVLSDSERRAEYDAYLAEQRQSRSMEDLMADALAEIRRAEEAVARDAQETPPLPSPTISQQLPAVNGGPPSVPPVSTPGLSEAARREALARRLMSGRTPSRTSIVPPKPPSQTSSSRPPVSIPSAAEAMGALRRRYEDRVAVAKAAMVKRYVDAGEVAVAAKDILAAASSFRIASSLAPDDPALAARAREAQGKADILLAETYSRQAGYEEKNEQWAEAARSWARVCRARTDDANAHERAANALVKANGDMHDAGRLAQRACMLEPDKARFRVTLATVYQLAGLALNARRELEVAAQLSPQDDTIQAMIRRAGKTTP